MEENITITPELDKVETCSNEGDIKPLAEAKRGRGRPRNSFKNSINGVKIGISEYKKWLKNNKLPEDKKE